MKPNYSTRKSDNDIKLYKHKALVRNTAENILIKNLSLELTHNTYQRQCHYIAVRERKTNAQMHMIFNCYTVLFIHTNADISCPGVNL